MKLSTIGFTRKTARRFFELGATLAPSVSWTCVDWATYERRFLDLMHERRIEETTPKASLPTAACLAAKISRTNAIGARRAL